MEKAKFTITRQSAAPDIKFEAAGYIVYDTAGQFEKVLNDAFQENPERITIDMEKVTVFTSLGVRVMLKAYKTATEKEVELKIENPSDIVRNVLKLSKLDIILLK